jgi:hypothetical protein
MESPALAPESTEPGLCDIWWRRIKVLPKLRLSITRNIATCSETSLHAELLGRARRGDGILAWEQNINAGDARQTFTPLSFLGDKSLSRQTLRAGWPGAFSQQ